MHRYFAGLRLALLALVCASAVFAQRDLGTLVGTVTDTTGGVVSNAKVTVTEAGTGQVYELTTNSAGEIVRPALKPSTYSISVSATHVGGYRINDDKTNVTDRYDFLFE